MKGTTVTDITSIAKNWAISTRENINGLYRLALIDSTFDNVNLESAYQETWGKDLKDMNVPREFIFDLPPRNLEMEEPAAVTITPTQGGIFIEHQGNIINNISITGTTGMRPNKKANGNIVPLLGVANPFAGVPDKADLGLNGLPKGERTGFEALIMLRNMFRAYYQLKKNPRYAHRVLLVWQNGKEGEYWVVEPLVFRASRDSASPLTHTYNIQLKTIHKTDAIVHENIDVFKNMEGKQNFQQTLVECLRRLTVSLNTVAALADATVGLAQSAISTIVIPATQVLNAVAATAGAVARGFTLQRNAVALLATSSQNMFVALQQIERERNANSPPTGLTQRSELAHALKEIFRVTTRLAKEDSLYSESIGTKFSAKSAAYNHPVTGAPKTGGSPTNLTNVATPAAAALGTVSLNDTIFTLAMKYLGDRARWKELVILNDLKAPYIDVNGDGIGILRPNDQIMYPSAAASQSSVVARDKTGSQTKLESRLGRDLKVVLTGDGVFDLVRSKSGDLATVYGIENMTQAVEIKFNTERGELPAHPTFGAKAAIGRKLTVNSLVEFNIDARFTLLQDSRIKQVNSFQIVAEGNKQTVKANISLIDADDAVSVSFDSRR